MAWGQVAAIASGRPVSPSQHTMRTPADAAVSQLCQDPSPEARALGLLDPHPQNLFDAIDSGADRDMAGLHPDRAAVSDPKPDRVDVHDRVNLVQRLRPPVPRDLVDRVGGVRDRLVRHRRAVRGLKALSDIAGRYSCRTTT